MAYTITVVVSQTARPFFELLDKPVFTGASWKESPSGEQVLHMPSSGTSGALYFFSQDTLEQFVVSLGIHNYHPWGDIIVDLKGEAVADILPSYYRPEYGGTGNPERVKIVSQTSKSIEYDGRTYSFKFTATSGHDLRVEVGVSPPHLEQ